MHALISNRTLAEIMTHGLLCESTRLEGEGNNNNNHRKKETHTHTHTQKKQVYDEIGPKADLGGGW
jgi:hypothetical protein